MLVTLLLNAFKFCWFKTHTGYKVNGKKIWWKGIYVFTQMRTNRMVTREGKHSKNNYNNHIGIIGYNEQV